MDHVVRYKCLGCGKQIGIQAFQMEKHDDKMLLKTLEGKCPNCGRQLNQKSERMEAIKWH